MAMLGINTIYKLLATWKCLRYQNDYKFEVINL